MTNLKAREALVPEGGLDPFDAAHDELKMEAGRRSNRIVTEGVEGSMAWLGSLYHVFVSNRVKVAPGTGNMSTNPLFCYKAWNPDSNDIKLGAYLWENIYPQEYTNSEGTTRKPTISPNGKYIVKVRYNRDP